MKFSMPVNVTAKLRRQGLMKPVLCQLSYGISLTMYSTPAFAIVSRGRQGIVETLSFSSDVVPASFGPIRISNCEMRTANFKN